ncbi:hypothetical protein [Natronorubrum sp. FCH18a]|uniref:hypothetical protein n=1 Tax=Natronorubrum sp. FCH18a TaxID=3447018 RepID=UPI003F518DAE
MPEGNPGDSASESMEQHEGEEITEVVKEDGRIRIVLESGWYFEFDEYNHGTVFDLE